MSNGPMEVISPFVLRAIACDIEEMQSPQAWADRCRAAAAEIEKLRAALGLAIDAVEHWASYASPYYQEKHDLAGDLQKLRAALGEKE